MKELWLVSLGVMLVSCATQPILNHDDYTKYCTKPGVCETYLRAKTMQYQNIGPVVVGVTPAPVPTRR